MRKKDLKKEMEKAKIIAKIRVAEEIDKLLTKKEKKMLGWKEVR